MQFKETHHDIRFPESCLHFCSKATPVHDSGRVGVPVWISLFGKLLIILINFHARQRLPKQLVQGCNVINPGKQCVQRNMLHTLEVCTTIMTCFLCCGGKMHAESRVLMLPTCLLATRICLILRILGLLELHLCCDFAHCLLQDSCCVFHLVSSPLDASSEHHVSVAWIKANSQQLCGSKTTVQTMKQALLHT